MTTNHHLFAFSEPAEFQLGVMELLKTPNARLALGLGRSAGKVRAITEAIAASLLLDKPERIRVVLNGTSAEGFRLAVLGIAERFAADLNLTVSPTELEERLERLELIDSEAGR